MKERLERVVKAWAASRQHVRAELTAERLLKTSKGELRAALHFTRNGRTATTPRALGNWLANNCDTLCAGYRIRRKYDAKVKRFHWYLEKVSDDELRRLAYQDSLAERERRGSELKASEPAPKPESFVYVTPASSDWFTHEKSAEQAARLLNESYLNASVDFGPGGRCAVRVVDSSVREVTLVCRKIRALEFCRVRERSGLPSESQPNDEQKDTVFDPVLRKFVPVRSDTPAGLGYNPDARFIRPYQDHRDDTQAIPLRPLSSWSPFDIGTPREAARRSPPVDSIRRYCDDVLSSGFLPDGRTVWNKGK